MFLQSNGRRNRLVSSVALLLLVVLLSSCLKDKPVIGEDLSPEPTLASTSISEVKDTAADQTDPPAETTEPAKDEVDFMPQSFRANYEDLDLVLLVTTPTDIQLFVLTEEPDAHLSTDYVIRLEEQDGENWVPVTLSRPDESGTRMINDFMRIFVKDDGSYTVTQNEDIALSSLDGGFFNISYDLEDYTELRSNVSYRLTKSFSIGDSPYTDYVIEFSLRD